MKQVLPLGRYLMPGSAKTVDITDLHAGYVPESKELLGYFNFLHLKSC